MAKSDLLIDILGTNFTISAEESAEYLDMLLGKYRRTIENVQRTTGLKDPLKIAVLTGFLLCDDLEKAGSSSDAVKNEEQGEAERLTEGMILRLNEIISNAAELAAEPEGIGPKVRDSPPSEEDVYVEKIAESPSIYKLQNTVKNYDWGSTDWIPALLGQKNTSRIPQAELWMGVNPSAPSRIKLSDSESLGRGPLLSEAISRRKDSFLGTETAGKFGTLPFLFKVLAAEKPLSIQAHPDLQQACNGFERENLKGIPLDAPERSYKNPSDKPEIICAISNFRALCGFRAAREICFLFEILSMKSNGALKAGFEKLISALKQQEENPLKTFLSALFSMDNKWLEMLCPFLREQIEQFGKDFPEYSNEWELCVYLSGFFPNDPGILSPLYLNIIELAPGEAMFIPAGILHSYIRGLGIELMADSDNVLRGGLSSKHIDKAELLSVLSFSRFKPEIMKLPDPAPFCFKYPTTVGDFSLSVMHGSGEANAYNEAGPSIVIVTSGCVITNQAMVLDTGESAFIPPLKNLELSGTFTAYLASVKVSSKANSKVI